MRASRAFSLVELLITIGLIGALTACLMAGLPMAREAVKRGQCTARLKAISQALFHYANDNDNTLPASATPTYGVQQGIWFDYRLLVTPYLEVSGSREQMTFLCPNSGLTQTSYLFNGANQYNPNFKGLAGRRLSAISQPTQTLLLTEMPVVFGRSWHVGKSKPSHNNSKNFVSFADGHVAMVNIFWNGAAVNAGVNPPAEYGYIWGD